MSLRVILRNVENGDAGVYIANAEWRGSFIWEEGNYGCDCNRGIFLYGRDSDIDCGENLIVVEGIYDEQGTLLWKDAP